MSGAGSVPSRRWPKVVLALLLGGIGVVVVMAVLGVVVAVVTWPGRNLDPERGCRESELAHIRAATTGDRAPEGAPLRPREVAEARGDRALAAVLAEAEAGR